MTGPTPALTAFHRAADVARILRCSEWWVKEQARRRRIPYCWIGGSYLFTDMHVAEIVRVFEVRPMPETRTTAGAGRPARVPTSDRDEAPTVVQLRARQPRRTRAAGVPDVTAA
jgi:hypothetical protein